MYFNTRSFYIVSLVTTLLLLSLGLLLSSCTDQPVEPALNDRSETAEDLVDMPDDNKSDTKTADVEINNDPECSNNTVEPKMPYIGIYGGIGTWDINVEAFINFFDHYDYPWIMLSEDDVTGGEIFDEIDAIIYPGGFAAEYKYSIPDHDSLIYFVENGGVFIGVCAGAYYASQILTWQGEDYSYPLGFYEGRGIGPLSGLVNWGDIADFKLTQGHPANDGFDQSIELYYFDGPYFKIEEIGSAEVLASYKVNSQPAVIAGRHGQGKYLLFGPHPELGGYSSQSPDFNLHGEEGAQWPWLQSSLHWLFNW